MEKRAIRTSAKALVIRDGKMLAIRIDDQGDVFYILPGGGQEAGELLPEAVSREVAEETGIRVRPESLVFVIEGRSGESFHRIDLVFLCADEGEIPNAVLQKDCNQTGCVWLPVDESLLKAPLYPSRLRRQILRLCRGEPADVYLGNEEIGDPEETTY